VVLPHPATAGSGLCGPHRGRPESGRRAAASRTCC
jgi:hypothetical protein